MKNKIKRILVVLMAVVMLVSSSNLQSFAAEMEDSGISITGEEIVITPEKNVTDPDLEEQETAQPIQEDEETSAEEEIVADEIEPVQEEESNIDENSSEPEEEPEDTIIEESSEQGEQNDELSEVVEEQAEESAEEYEDSDEELDEESEEVEVSKEIEEPVNAEESEENPDSSVTEESEEEPVPEMEKEESSEMSEELSEESEESRDSETEGLNEEKTEQEESREISEESEKSERAVESETEDESEEPLEDIVIVPDPFVPLEAWYEFSVGGKVSYPLTEEGVITTLFGQVDDDHSSPHQGIDLAAGDGSPVITVKAGTVAVTHVWNGTVEDSYGNYVDIQHEDGLVTRYAHLSEINISEGMEVAEGQQIGRVGSTGRSTGAHLHFEVIVNDENVDPYYYLYPVTIVFDLNYNYGTIHLITEEESYKYFMETIPYVYRDAKTGKEVYAEDGHLLKLTDPEVIRMDAYDAFGYAIPVTAYSLTGEMVEIYRDKEGFYQIPTDGSVVRVLAGKEMSRGLMMKSGGTNAAYTDGMTLETNAVLRFAQAIGFDVSAYLSSAYAWQVVNGTADGLYSTTEGQAMMSGSIPYTDGGAIGSGTANSVWPGINLWIGADDFEELNTYLHSGTYSGVQCAGLVNTFFGYIYQKLYTDADWKAYYDAYSYGTANDLSGTFDSWNNVGSVEAGLEGLYHYKDANGYYVQVCDNYTMTHDDFVAMLDDMAPGAIIRFSNNQAGIYDGNGNYRLQHAGIYIGEANGLHWMLHTNDYSMKARIVPLEYYSMSFNNGSEDPHKGKVWITRAGGMDAPDKTGYLVIQKNPKNPSLVSGNTNYSLSGAVYGVYSGTTEVGRLTTDANGKTNTLELDAGTYTVKEITAPKGYLLDTTVYSVVIKPTETNSLGVVDDHDTGLLKVIKTSSNTAVTDNNTNYSSKGAEFTVYTDAACTQVVTGAVDASTGASITKLVVKDDAGNTNTMKLPVAGTYYVKETKAPSDGSYEISSEVKKVTVAVGKTESVSFKDKPKTSELSLTKASSLPSVTNGNSCYSLTGTEYTIYRTKNGNTLSNPWPTKLTVKDETGKTNVVTDLPAGTYYVKETKSGKGYLTDTNIYTVVLKPGDSKELKMTDVPMNDPEVIQVYKHNGNGEDEDLAGARFKIEFYAAYYESISAARQHTPTRTWTIETKKDSQGRYIAVLSQEYLIAGSSELYSFGGNTGLPLGTIIISEVKAATGYNNDPEFTNKATTVSYGSTFFGQVKMNGNVGALYTGNTKIQEDGFEVDDTRIRGDFEFDKLDGRKQIPLGGFSFRITMLDKNGNKMIGAAYTAVIKTDSNGHYSSKDDASLWIGTDLKDSSLGKLPYGKYIVEELETEENKDYELIAPFTVEIKNNNETVDKGPFYDFEKPTITTELTADGLHLCEAKESVILVDTISYQNMQSYIGKTVTVKGVIMDQDGNTIFEHTMTFKPEMNAEGLPDGTVQNSFTFDASNMAGKTVVCYEYISFEGKTICLHEDPKDQKQQVKFPQIGTTAKDAQTDDHLMLADKQAKIIDTVAYKNLIQGKTYTLEGILYDQITGNPLLINGEKVVTVATFVAESANGSVEMEFSFDASELAGHSLVVFEQLKVEGKIIGRHEDLSDEGQTIHVPDGGTTAADSETGDHISFADQEITIIDRVEYKNLIPGKEYTVLGKLMDKATGDVLTVDGIEVTAEKTFTAEKADGYVEISFTFDGSLLENHTLVAFETIQYKGKDIFVHADLEDEDQTVYIPKIRTKAKDSITGTELANCAGPITLIDTVTYENLISGKTYTLKAVLMDKETKSPIIIGDKPVVGSVEFTAETSDGTADVMISLNAESLQGRDLIFYEELYLDDTVIAEHKDIEDQDQTIKVPDVQTKARDENGNQTIPDHGQVTVIDEVQYRNLVPGRKYRLRCIIMLRSTGEEAESQEQYIVSERSFTPEESDGSTVIHAIIPVADDFVGEALVVYEYLSWNDLQIAVHTDIADEEQTVRIPKIGTTATDSQTEDHITLAAENAKIIDTVFYQNVTRNEAFILVGTLMNKGTGEPVKDEGGNPVTALAYVIPTTENGEVQMEFIFDARSLAGEDVVVFEEMYVGDVLVASHVDLNDEGQTIHIPGGGTTATDNKTKEHAAMISERTEITDVVKYKNLIPGREYTVTGILMDRETGEPLLIDDEPVTAEIVFIADQKDGEIALTFIFDSRELAGKSVVAFESIQYEGRDVFFHADLEDEDQTVSFPWIETEAFDTKTGDHLMWADSNAVIVDKVNYKNLIPGKEYELCASLMDADTGAWLGVGSVTKLTPETSDGVADVIINIDAKGWEGTTFVVFEQLRLNDEVIAVHEDFADEKQTIHVPRIQTLALDFETKDHIAPADGMVKVIDTVSYYNLIPGKIYMVLGILQEQDTGKTLRYDGYDVVSVAYFVPDQPDGEIEMEFNFDATGLEGKTIVAFEWIHLGEEALVAWHVDENDEAQMIHFPGGETHARDQKTDDHIAGSGEITLIDLVEYRNLIPGKKYTVEGELYVKETGEQLLDGKGNPVKAQAEFIAEKADGSIELTFVFDGSLLEGKAVVVFEMVMYKEWIVFEHSDFTDEEQSVHIPKIGTTARDQNGTQMSLADDMIEIIDTVCYENLVPDREYFLEGVVMDKETGEVLPGMKPVRMSFIPETANGTVEVVFDLDGTDLEGKTLVIFEKLYLNEQEIASHEDLEDDGQTIYVPEIRTTSSDVKTGTHTALAEEKVQIKDVVSYHNLIPGKKYTVIGTLMDKKTEDMLMVNGEPVMTSVTFTTDKPDGEIEMLFELDGSALEGKTVVVFEDIFFEYKQIASHADFSNEEQSIHFPEVRTLATVNGQKRVNVSAGLITITDTVSYKNLIPGVEYTLQARLMDKQTGKPAMLDGKEIKVEVKFTSDQTDGTVSIQLQVNAEDYPDHDLVVFETLIQTDIQKVVGQHEDLQDADQTIHVTKHPETGDTTNVICWIAVLMISFGFLSWCIYQEWKMRRK